VQLELRDVTFTGGPIDDHETLDRLPADLRALLAEANGFVAYHGGFHVRGACRTPEWHSLRAAWVGPSAFYELYEAVEPTDVPFAEDAGGDQWLLRAGKVVQLLAETGDIEPLDVDLRSFLANVQASPVDALGLHPVLKFRADAGVLRPGELLNVYPPFCTEESAAGVSLAAVSTQDRRLFLADLARQLPDSGQFNITFE
jgi:hypothetical protein